MFTNQKQKNEQSHRSTHTPPPPPFIGSSFKKLIAGLDVRLVELFPFGIPSLSSHDETFWLAGGKMSGELGERLEHLALF